jgi:hypothetical protein
MVEPAEKKPDAQTDVKDRNEGAPTGSLTSKLALGPTPTLAPAVSPLAPPPASAVPPAVTTSVAPPPAKTAAPEFTVADAYKTYEDKKQKDEAERIERQIKDDAQREKLRKEQEGVTRSVLTASEIAELKRGKLPMPKTKDIPYKEPEKTSLAQQWGSGAMIIAMLASGLTRNRAVTALDAATAAMKGFQEGDKAKAEDAYKQWKVANENMLKTFNSELNVYKEIMREIDSEEKLKTMRGTAREKEIDAELKAIDAAYNNFAAKQISEEKGLEGRYYHLIMMQKTAAQTEKQTAELEAAKRHLDLISDPNFKKNFLTREQQLFAEFQTGHPPAVARYNAYLASKQVADEERTEKLSELEKDTKYINATPGEQLHMRAALGEKKAQDEISKMLAKQEQVRAALFNPTTETQRNNDLAIANYMQEPPKQPASGNASAKAAYEMQMERVRKLNSAYNPTDYRLYAKAKENWTVASGQGAKNISAMNTSAQHLSEFKQLLDAVDTGDVGIFNRVRNGISAVIGFPNREVNDINAARRLVADEIVKSVMNSAGALADRDEMAALLDGNLPITKLKDNVAILQTLQGGRLNAMQKLFETGTGLQGQEAKDAFNKRLTSEVLASYGPYLGLNRDQVTESRRAADVESRERLKSMGVSGSDGKNTTDQKPPGQKVGDIIKQGEKQYRVTKVDANGKPTDAVEITAGP